MHNVDTVVNWQTVGQGPIDNTLYYIDPLADPTAVTNQKVYNATVALHQAAQKLRFK